MRVLAALVMLGLAGCGAGAALDREIALARAGDEAFSSFDDLVVAERALPARLERLEALVREAPESTDVRTMLVIAWAREGLLFAEDDAEDAFERHDAPSARYHAMRAQNAYDRAIHHGSAWLSFGGQGFDQAVANGTVDGFMAARKDDPRALAWLGAAFVSRARLTEKDAAKAASLDRAGRAILERSIALDPAAAGGFALATLGYDRAKNGNDVEGAKRDLERCLTVSKRRLLLAQVYLGRTVVCASHDRAAWDAAYQEVLDARDPEADVRLENAAAKRLAERDIRGTRRALCVP